MVLLYACLSCTAKQKSGNLGDFITTGGELIRDCKIGYRTFGRLDSARSNAVLFVPWFQGTSRELAHQVGPGELVDSSHDFVIAIDALGNGVSSSPSNSTAQPGAAFPRVTIEDMVRSQYLLLTRVLGIAHLKAVVGISMGGMQALAWATEYPGFADAVVSIVGTPRATEGDRRYWQRQIAAATRPAWRRAMDGMFRLEASDVLRQLRIDPADFALQAETMRAIDLPAAPAGPMARAARTLVVVSERDDVVDPGPARELAGNGMAELLVLDGRCGHQAPKCERKALVAAVRRFLAGGKAAGPDSTVDWPAAR